MSWGKLLLWKRVRLGNMNKLHVEWGDKKKSLSWADRQRLHTAILLRQSRLKKRHDFEICINQNVNH